jgi:hypothetical protein
MIARDAATIRKLPRHVAVILDQRKTKRSYDADETIRRAVEVTTWCACSGISIVTIYEPTGNQPDGTWLTNRVVEEGYQEDSTEYAKDCSDVLS